MLNCGVSCKIYRQKVILSGFPLCIHRPCEGYTHNPTGLPVRSQGCTCNPTGISMPSLGCTLRQTPNQDTPLILSYMFILKKTKKENSAKLTAFWAFSRKRGHPQVIARLFGLIENDQKMYKFSNRKIENLPYLRMDLRLKRCFSQ